MRKHAMCCAVVLAIAAAALAEETVTDRFQKVAVTRDGKTESKAAYSPLKDDIVEPASAPDAAVGRGGLFG